MNNSDLNRFLDPQYSFTSADISLLENTVKTYPWFQVAHQFLAKAKYQIKDNNYPFYLNQSSIYALDREVLFDYIYKTKAIVHPKIVKATEVKIKEPVKKAKTKDEIKETTEISLGTIKTAEGEDVKSKDELQKIVKEQLDRIERERLSKKPSKKETAPENGTTKIKKQLPKVAKTTGATSVDREKEKKINQKVIMEDFIKTEPSVSRPKDGPYVETLRLAKESLEDNLDFVSETLAEIYFKQDNPQKAVKIYEQLMLKVPEKKLYFAARIKEIVDNK